MESGVKFYAVDFPLCNEPINELKQRAQRHFARLVEELRKASCASYSNKPMTKPRSNSWRRSLLLVLAVKAD
jgi:hypothetical protein